ERLIPCVPPLRESRCRQRETPPPPHHRLAGSPHVAGARGGPSCGIPGVRGLGGSHLRAESPTPARRPRARRGATERSPCLASSPTERGRRGLSQRPARVCRPTSLPGSRRIG